LRSNKRFEITGNGLKFIAMITMLVDHFAYGIYRDLAYINGWEITIGGIDIYRIMRLVGRMAFPIYCFLLVEGYFYTSNYVKYAVRLFILALISELPFDLAVNFRPSFLEYNNVIFTLLIGLLTIGAMDYIEGGNISFLDKLFVKRIAEAVVAIAGCSLAAFMRTDYNAAGVAAIIALYSLHGIERENRIISFALAVIILAIGSSSSEYAALLMLVPIYFYEGNRGSNSKVLRHCFNLFYPVHLGIIALVAKFFIQ